ncbi:putative transcription factor interactor and regulator CCHC(Zn) family [Abeliophyllum distichum]|uniref:Transcription factor interactor and regulator CCHC(Zn) family n=1 Tax=Abeliophyllum distichum TaxID=126358 RepID=A0ABD1SXD4_9LAMI
MSTIIGSLSISKFLDRINAVTDNLALVNLAYEDDLVTIIIQNVGPAYETIVSSGQARNTPITYEGLEALLVSTEMRFNEYHRLILDNILTVLNALRPHGFGRCFPFSRRCGARGRSPVTSFGHGIGDSSFSSFFLM